MAPLLIMYQAYEHGGLPYSLQCGDGKYWPERIGLDTNNLTSHISLPTSLDDIQATGRRLQTATAPVCQATLRTDAQVAAEQVVVAPQCMMTPLQDDPVGFVDDSAEPILSVVTGGWCLFGGVCLAVGAMLLDQEQLGVGYEWNSSTRQVNTFLLVLLKQHGRFQTVFLTSSAAPVHAAVQRPLRKGRQSLERGGRQRDGGAVPRDCD